MNRYFSSFIITLFFYTLGISSFLYSYDQKKQVSSPLKQKQQTVSFNVLREKKKKEIPTKIKEQKIRKKKVLKQTYKKKIVKSSTNTAKKVAKKIDTNKIKKTKDKATQVVVKNTVKKEIKKKILKEKKILPQIKAKNKNLVQKDKTNQELEQLKREQNRYFKELKNKISRGKTYPRLALRRGIQGDVKVNLTITNKGELVNFNIIDGKKVFKKSIINSITKSFPFPPPKDLFSSNLEITFLIEYKIN